MTTPTDEKLKFTMVPKTATLLPFRFEGVAYDAGVCDPDAGVVATETPPTNNSVDPNIVRLLEDYLKAAKEGKITFIAIASVSNDGIAHSTWEPEEAEDHNPQLITQALGAVSYLNHRFNRSCDEGAVYDDSANL